MEKNIDKDIDLNNQSTSQQDKSNETTLSEHERLIINKKANKLLNELSKLLKEGVSKSTRVEIKNVLDNLDTCAKKMKSEFLDDIVFIVRKVLNSKKEKKGE